ncbi:MAG: hypothetical protein F6K40_29805 [Okeania sp. SIO3I5]|uniref:hypothetical protein n=1 Tax=Okeania sp. SIO3I5 TaxID=2607805 RepID=UPI0013B6F129|nr:hypothetical protein [Okeania sp. SIO3I5]NEQ40213.1 hypothetical protein [Okeania sp. SIO3I5]
MNTEKIEKVVITQPSNSTENQRVLPDLPDGNSPVGIILATSVLIGAIAKLIKVLVPVMKKNNK